MRSQRLATSTPELDATEATWWDEFSATCERLWTFDEDTALAARGSYLAAGADYLAGGGPGGRATILDLGCGSGFTSRFLAGRGARVVGVDVSPEQIQLAEASAAAGPTEAAARMEFRVASTSELRDAGEQYDGVIGHAFLHHLATDELRALLDEVAALLRPGGRAWFLEPVFYPEGESTGAARLTKAGAMASSVLQRGVRSVGQLDSAPLAAADEFFARADREGWFLSPKEVPFAPGELERVFSGPLRLKHFSWVSTASYPTAQWVALVRDPRLRAALAGTIVRAHARTDLTLGRSGSVRRLRGLDGYGFAALACRVAG